MRSLDDHEEPSALHRSSAVPFSTVLQNLNGNAVVVLAGELDMDAAPQLVEVLDPLLSKGPADIVLDFSGVSFIDSSGIAVLVRAENRLREQGRHIRVRSPRSQALRVFEVTGLTEFVRQDGEQAGNGNGGRSRST